MYCKYCGAEQSNGARYCNSCGKALSAVETTDVPEHIGEEIKKEAIRPPSRLIALMAVCAAVSILGYVLQSMVYGIMTESYFESWRNYPYGDSSFFSIWYMLIPVIVGCGLIYVLNRKGKILDGRLSKTAYLIPCIAFVLKYGIHIFTIWTLSHFAGSIYVIFSYIPTMIIEVYGLGYIWPWLMLACYLTVSEVPSAHARRNMILVICVVFIWVLVLTALRSQLGWLVMNGSGLPQESMAFLNPIVFLFSWIERIVLLYLPLLAARRKKWIPGAVMFFTVVLIAATLLSLGLILWLHIGLSGYYIAEILAYIAGAVVLLRLTRKSRLQAVTGEEGNVL